MKNLSRDIAAAISMIFCLTAFLLMADVFMTSPECAEARQLSKEAEIEVCY